MLTVAMIVAAPIGQYYGIRVIDEASGRGIPLIELRTVNDVVYVTDSAGWIAFREPDLMGHETWFHVSGHGYEVPEDGFGNRGVTLTPTAGGRAEVRLRRRNIAERLCRLTGADRYRDSILLGERPADRPLPGLVMGQDTVMAAPYRGKLYWFWGDTNRPAYPLGLFRTAGATTPRDLDPEAGIAFDYFVRDDGFCRAMIPLDGPGVVWIDAVIALPDAAGGERLLCRYDRREGLGELHERGLAIWDDATERFVRHRPLDAAVRLHPTGQPFIDGGWVYFADACPMVRCPATVEGYTDPSAWESHTPLPAGARWSGAATTPLERDAAGRLVWGWKPGTDPLDQQAQEEMVKAGRLSREESPFALRDADTGRDLVIQHGSVRWNEHRRAFVMIACEQYGQTSLLGEIWYAEAPRPEGPWRMAKHIVTHDDYSFYNPVHHAFLDRDGGRVIYFEGTYTKTFSGTATPTPRYDYNQILYRLDLDDERLQTAAPR